MKRSKVESPPAGAGCAHFKYNLPQNAQMCHLNRSRFPPPPYPPAECWLIPADAGCAPLNTGTGSAIYVLMVVSKCTVTATSCPTQEQKA